MGKPSPSASVCSWHRSFLRSLRQRRSLSLLAWFVAVVLFLHLAEQHYVYRQSYLQKYSATDLSSLGINSTAPYLPFFDKLLPREPSDDQDAGLEPENPYIFIKDLGRGWEGWAQLFQERATGDLVVIKRFRSHKSPFRNCVPLSIQHRFQGQTFWPSELPAALVFGGLDHSAARDPGRNARSSNGHDFLPVCDYYLAKEPGAKNEEWHMVSPYVTNGTLLDLAKRNRRRKLGFRELDNKYRDSFQRLLQTLETMHRSEICHDDIKPANIFAVDDTTWLVGDFGNVRELNHPYHNSRLWRETRPWTDCRINDVYRALKTYLGFLRRSCSDREAFDEQFFQGREPWSRMFWDFHHDPKDAASMALFSMHREAPDGLPHYVTFISGPAPSYWSFDSLTHGHQRVLEDRVTKILEGHIHDTYPWYIGLGWVFSVGPKPSTCSAPVPRKRR